MLMTAPVLGVAARALVAGVVSAGCSRAIGTRRVPEYLVAGPDMPPAAPPEVSQPLECHRSWHPYRSEPAKHLRAVLNMVP
jgi:hypothetical protein